MSEDESASQDPASPLSDADRSKVVVASLRRLQELARQRAIETDRVRSLISTGRVALAPEDNAALREALSPTGANPISAAPPALRWPLPMGFQAGSLAAAVGGFIAIVVLMLGVYALTAWLSGPDYGEDMTPVVVDFQEVLEKSLTEAHEARPPPP